MAIRRYSELIALPSFDERLLYLRLSGTVGLDTFGSRRYLNQALYQSYEWKKARRLAIIRDNGCDLGLSGHEIFGKILIHHLNPITVEDVLNRDSKIFDLENLICVSFDTHNAIHYGAQELRRTEPVERFTNDTCPWK